MALINEVLNHNSKWGSKRERVGGWVGSIVERFRRLAKLDLPGKDAGTGARAQSSSPAPADLAAPVISDQEKALFMEVCGAAIAGSRPDWNALATQYNKQAAEIASHQVTMYSIYF